MITARDLCRREYRAGGDSGRSPWDWVGMDGGDLEKVSCIQMTGGCDWHEGLLLCKIGQGDSRWRQEGVGGLGFGELCLGVGCCKPV